MKRLPMLLLIAIGLAACGGVASPSDAFLIPMDEVKSVVRRADDGDLAAIKRLIAHYDASSGSDAAAEKWRDEARRLGDPDELYYYAARLETAARAEVEPARRQKLLHEALQSAMRAKASRSDPSSDRLVEELNKALATR
jgi:hypothetical protein